MENLKKIKSFAKKVHQGQKRKSGEPFFSHPWECCRRLEAMEYPQFVQVAGLLHDSVEDSQITINDLKKIIPEMSYRIVEALTFLKKYTKKVNFEKLLQKAKKIPYIIIVKMVDRLHNLQTLQYLDKDCQMRHIEETRDMMLPMFDEFMAGLTADDVEGMLNFLINNEKTSKNNLIEIFTIEKRCLALATHKKIKDDYERLKDGMLLMIEEELLAKRTTKKVKLTIDK